MVRDALMSGQSGGRRVSHIRRKNGEYIWVQFSTQFADEYINGYQVAYSVLTNIDDLVKMQKERSVTYESLPGFVAKYRVSDQLKLTLLEANDRFIDYFGGETNRGERSLYHQNISHN